MPTSNTNTSSYEEVGGYKMIQQVMTIAGTTKNARINALSAILKATGINITTIHGGNCRSLMNAIHSLLVEDEMRIYLQHIIDHPGFIKLDPVIEEIFNGKYMLLAPELQGNTKEIVDNTLHAR